MPTRNKYDLENLYYWNGRTKQWERITWDLSQTVSEISAINIVLPNGTKLKLLTNAVSKECEKKEPKNSNALLAKAMLSKMQRLSDYMNDVWDDVRDMYDDIKDIHNQLKECENGNLSEET